MAIRKILQTVDESFVFLLYLLDSFKLDSNTYKMYNYSMKYIPKFTRLTETRNQTSGLGPDVRAD